MDEINDKAQPCTTLEQVVQDPCVIRFADGVVPFISLINAMTKSTSFYLQLCDVDVRVPQLFPEDGDPAGSTFRLIPAQSLDVPLLS